MANQLIVEKAARDEDAGVWYVEASDLPGLNAEAETLLNEAGSSHGHEVPIEVIAYASTCLRAVA